MARQAGRQIGDNKKSLKSLTPIKTNAIIFILMAFTKKPFKNFKKTPKIIVVDEREVDYKNTDVLKNFIDYNTGKILNLRQAGLKAKVIRKVKRAIKRSRAVGLMPFTTTVNH